MRRARDRGLVAALVAFLLALAASVFLAVYPVGSTRSSSSVTTDATGALVSGPTVVRHRRTTLLEVEGPSVLIVLGVPVAIAFAAVAITRLRARAGGRAVLAGFLGVGCLLGAMSVGMFYLPALAALLVSVARSDAAAVSGRGAGTLRRSERDQEPVRTRG